MTQTIFASLSRIQKNLRAPKNQRNSFGNYNYRSCEDILEGLKRCESFQGLSIIITDEIVQVGERYYVKATATLHNDTESVSNTAYARESEDKKGMDSSQVTGATSSYARKYALNGLFAIDDVRDADTQDNRASGTEEKKESEAHTSAPVSAIKCETCGAPAQMREGVSKKSGKPYKAVFCSSQDATHTKWINETVEDLPVRDVNDDPYGGFTG